MFIYTYVESSITIRLSLGSFIFVHVIIMTICRSDGCNRIINN